jgi:ABC-type nitrate/sulfonate/bicarbonate transport system substrate-binding protein
VRLPFSRALGLALLAAGALAACGGTASSPSRPAASSAAARPELSQVKMVYATANGEYAFLHMALDHGFFQNQGLAPSVGYAQSTTGIASLMSGEAQINFSDGVSAAEGVASGARLAVIAYFTRTSIYAVYGNRDVASASELKGKTFAIGKAGDTSDVSARIGLKQIGLVPQDLTFLQAGNSPARWAALTSGQVAGAVLDQDAYGATATANGMHLLIDLNKQKLPYVATAVVVTREFAAANPNTVRAALRGILDGSRYFVDPGNRTEAMTYLAREMKLNAGDPLVKAAYDAFSARLGADPFPDAAGMDLILEALKSIDAGRYGALTSQSVIEPSFMAAIRQDR